MQIYLGKEIQVYGVKELSGLQNAELPISDMLGHVLINGATGCGKTVLGKAIIEDFAQTNIPVVAIDNKGDLGSLGLIFPYYQPQSFHSWIASGDKDEKKSLAMQYSKRYLHRLKLFGISPAAVETLSRSIRTTIFTPREDCGVRLKISPLPPAPLNIDDLLVSDMDLVMQLVGCTAVSLVERMYPGENLKHFEREYNFLSQLILHSWQNKLRLEGIGGIKLLVELIEHPPVKRIGVIPMDRFIMSHKRKDLAVKINAMLMGAEHEWYEGLPLEMETLLGEKVPTPKTQISIIDISRLEKTEDHSLVIARVAQTIYQWMKKQGPTKKPRLLFYIDEINKHGVHNSVFPKPPSYTAAKYMLTRLLECAGKYGVSVVLGASVTSNIDYRALAVCKTWAIGCLPGVREWQNLRNGLKDINLKVEQLAKDNNLAKAGEFVLKTKEGATKLFHQRWLVSFHRPFSVDDVKRFTAENTFEQTESFTKEVVSEDQKTLSYDPSGETGNYLEVQSGEYTGKKVYLKGGENSFGRQEFCPHNMHISRRHFRIIKKDGDYYIKDFSTNGTFIGGRRIDIRRLEPDDEIILGKDEVTLKYVR